LPYVCDWRDCIEQAIRRKWFREAGKREITLCGPPAERVNYRLNKAREYDRLNPSRGR
jgi:hypothetical protein